MRHQMYVVEAKKLKYNEDQQDYKEITAYIN